MFQEKQKFGQAWIALMILPLAALLLFEIVRKFILNKPTEFSSLYDVLLVIVPMIIAGLLFLLLRIELYTKIDSSGIFYKFSPFHKNYKVVEWHNVKKAYVRKYKPIREYGGWGARYGINGKAYNVAGKYGIQIVFNNGKKLLLGTQKPEELKELLKTYIHSDEPAI
jgi:hypothetical protein